jgi:hypothetical protein
MEESIAKDQITDALRAHLDDPVVKIAHFMEISLLVFIVILMVFKPF